MFRTWCVIWNLCWILFKFLIFSKIHDNPIRCCNVINLGPNLIVCKLSITIIKFKVLLIQMMIFMHIVNWLICLIHKSLAKEHVYHDSIDISYNDLIQYLNEILLLQMYMFSNKKFSLNLFSSCNITDFAPDKSFKLSPVDLKKCTSKRITFW